MAPPEVMYLRDGDHTPFAAEVVRLECWADGLPDRLAQIPDPELADVRVVFVEDPAQAPTERPDWLVVLPVEHERDRAGVVAEAARAWTASPWFRGPGPVPERYVEAGFQALCPPHPACPVGPGARDTLLDFVGGRPGTLGRLAREGRDAADRLWRVFWHSPEALAGDILRERIRDAGGRHLLHLTGFVEAAEVAPESEEHADLANERLSLLARLQPVRYFSEAADHDRAVALALDWRDRYLEAYAAHYEDVRAMVEATLDETADARAVLDELETLNRCERPVGGDAVRRLRDALAEVTSLPPEPDDRMAVTGRVVLGRLPSALAEARLAAAAVLAAAQVHQRRRASARSRIAHR